MYTGSMMFLAALAAAGAGEPAKLEGFSVGMELPCQTPVTPAVERALREIGIDYVNWYVKPGPGTPDEQAVAANREMLAFARRAGLSFSLSCYVVDPPDPCVSEALGTPRFQGIVFDELEHCRLLNIHSPTPLVDPRAFTSLAQAYETTLVAYRGLHDQHAARGVPVVATHVWPVLHHVAARAGFTPCPKICKEFYSSVSLAIGMGAALQYGRDLWADCDLWFWDLVPGHTPEEMRSNLLLAYWLGVDRVYLEGCGHNLTEAGAQGIPFSLMTQVTPERFQLTAHGEVLRGFIREYLPAHPRPWSFRDVRPAIAIVRFPDSCHGQRYTPGFPDHLYGSANLPSTADTEAWLQIWNVLTCGKTGTDGLSFFKDYCANAGYQRPPSAPEVMSLHTRPLQADTHRFFVPLNGAVVFDHLVGYDRLKGVPLLFLTGVDVSPGTMAALRRCATEGATVVMWGPLARSHGYPGYVSGVTVAREGQGKVILTDNFGDRRVFGQIQQLIGYPDRIRYRFGDHEVTLWRVTDNEVRVEVAGAGV